MNDWEESVEKINRALGEQEKVINIVQSTKMYRAVESVHSMRGRNEAFPSKGKQVAASVKHLSGKMDPRIVKADPFVFVSGTTAVTPEGTVYGEGDPYAQAKYIFTKLVKLLEENGVSKEEVVKVNIWATSSSYNMEITKAYSEFFKESRPCCTWIGIK